MKCDRPECNGADHHGRCHKCPHDGDPRLANIPWEKTPCSRCELPSDDRAGGHGRGVSMETIPPEIVADWPDAGEIEVVDRRKEYMLDALRALSSVSEKAVVSVLLQARGMTVNEVRRRTNALFHEDLTLQAVSWRIQNALRELEARIRL